MELLWRSTPASVADAHALIEDHGVVLLRQVFQPEWITAVAVVVDQLFEATAIAAKAGALTPDAVRDYKQRAIDVARLTYQGRAVVDDLAAPLLDLVAALLGAPAECHPHSFLRAVSAEDEEAGDGLRLPFHQDQRVLDRRLVNAWIPFVACGRDRPGLELVRRPLDGLVPAALHANSIYGLTGIEIPAPIVRVEYRGLLWAPDMMPGDALVFPGTTIHRSHVTPGMTGTRTSVDLRFVPAGAG